MSETVRSSALSREEMLLGWSAIGVLVAAIAFTLGAIFMS
jgi:hypothetical protein